MDSCFLFHGAFTVLFTEMGPAHSFHTVHKIGARVMCEGCWKELCPFNRGQKSHCVERPVCRNRWKASINLVKHRISCDKTAVLALRTDDPSGPILVPLPYPMPYVLTRSFKVSQPPSDPFSQEQIKYVYPEAIIKCRFRRSWHLSEEAHPYYRRQQTHWTC